jgi:phosphohistidine phosphatase
MLLFLVRHAHAVSEEENPKRPLSPKGEEMARRVARFLAQSGAFQPHQIWHSPLLRARQTAELVSAELPVAPPLVETADLLPEDEPLDVAKRIDELETTRVLAICGHEPHLSALATLLVRGKVEPVAFEMKKAAVLALERTPSVHRKSGLPRWIVSWHLAPQLLRGSAPEPSPGTADV